MKKVLQVIEQLRGYMGEEGKKAEEEEEKRKKEKGGRGGEINGLSIPSLVPNGGGVGEGTGGVRGGEEVGGGGVGGVGIVGASGGEGGIGGVSVPSSDDEIERVLKCLAGGMFLRSARLNKDGRTYTLQVSKKYYKSLIFFLQTYIDKLLLLLYITLTFLLSLLKIILPY